MMVKLFKRISIAIICVGFMAGSVWAVPYFPSNDDIASWDFVYTTDNSGITGGASTVSGIVGDAYSYSISDQRGFWFNFIKFVVDFEATTNSYYNGGAAFGSVTSFDLSSYTNFKVSLFNANENPWKYTLWVGNYDNSTSSPFTVYNSGITPIVNGSGQTLELDLNAAHSVGIDLTSAYIGFAVGEYLPIMGSGGS